MQQTWTHLIKLCALTLWERKTMRKACLKSPTQALLWNWRWRLQRWSKSDETSLRDGRIASPSFLDGTKRSESCFAHRSHDRFISFESLDSCTPEVRWRYSFFSLWKHRAKNKETPKSHLKTALATYWSCALFSKDKPQVIHNPQTPSGPRGDPDLIFWVT